MPANIQNTSSIKIDMAGIESADINYDDKYPKGIDLHPSSDLHKEVLNKILTYAQEAKDDISLRYDEWAQIDTSLTAFVPATIKKQAKAQGDQTDPVIDYNPLDDENSTYIDQGLEIGAARDYAIDEGLWGEDGWGFEENMDEFIESGDGVVSWDSDGYLKNTLQGAGAYTVLRSSGGGTNLTLNGYLYNQLPMKHKVHYHYKT